jgi:hypothetical protein
MAFDLTLEGQVQRILNNLLTEGLLPFKLNVGKITKENDAYHIYFYDSRIDTAVVTLVDGLPLDDLIRSAVLASVRR